MTGIVSIGPIRFDVGIESDDPAALEAVRKLIENHREQFEAIMDMVIAVNFFVLWQREKQVAEDRLNLRTEGVKAAIEVLRRPDEWRQPWL